MRNKFQSRFLLLLVPFLLFGAACSKSSPSVGPGKTAPDFAMHDISGNLVRLVDLRGSVVLLNFWATWCPPCREEVPSLIRLNAIMDRDGFRMLTVSLDDGGAAAVESFFRMTGHRLPTIPDSDGRLAKLYGVTGIPETFILDRDGVIRKKVVGPIDWDSPDVVGYLSELRNKAQTVDSSL